MEYLRPDYRRARSKHHEGCRGFGEQSGIWVSVQIWMLDPSNLLLMDESTTHLDIGSIDALIASLQDYEGTLIFISHDVHFIRAMACIVLHIGAGKLTPYAGDLNPYKTDPSLLPGLEFSNGHSKLSYYAGRSDVTYQVEKSINLSDWDQTALTISGLDAMLMQTAIVNDPMP